MRTTPLHPEHGDAVERWTTIRGMRIPSVYRSGGMESALSIADLSALPRCGLKGPAAVEWLATIGITVPDRHNRWADLPGGGVIGRLGHTEFFVEDGPEGHTVDIVIERYGTGVPGVYWVPHQDAAIVLTGERTNEVLVQTCNINFGAVEPRELVMTSMVGVSVLVIPRENRIHLWCDPTSGPYLWRTLLAIVRELGGAPVGIGKFYPEIPELK